jgi:hypothetical protein
VRHESVFDLHALSLSLLPHGVAGYVIFYSKDPILPEAAWATSVIKGNRLSTLIKDLDPNAAYFFKIQARNSEGVGPKTSPVTATVPDGKYA